MNTSARCDVCGVLVVVPEAQKASPTCWSCDVTVAAAMAKLLVQGHRAPDGWREKKADGQENGAPGL